MILSAVCINSSSYAIVSRVEKATSEFLTTPDWAVNISICEAINSLRWHPKEVMEAVKIRLRLKNPKIKLLALTLLDTMVNNCGDGVHYQIVKWNILQDMIKIVKKKKDMSVRGKILILLGSWKDRFDYGGRYPQYYWAYEELRRSGVQFPSSSTPDARVLFTPPFTHKNQVHSQAGYDTKLHESTVSKVENLSFSSLRSMCNVLRSLSDKLQAVTPNNSHVVKDETIVNLVEQCRINQKKLMLLLTLTEDEELLTQGIELNDGLQIVLANYNAIASGSSLVTKQPAQEHSSSSKTFENRRKKQESVDIQTSSPIPVKNQLSEEDDEAHNFEHKRHSKVQKINTGKTSSPTNERSISSNTSSVSETSSPRTNNLILVTDPPPSHPTKCTSNQDMIDLLSNTFATVPTTAQNIDKALVSPITQEPSKNYVVPWAQAKPQPEFSSIFTTPLAANETNHVNHNTTTYNPYQNHVYPSFRSSIAPAAASAQQKPYVPSYRLFEDLNVLGGVHGRLKTNIQGMSSQSMVGARKYKF